MPDVGLSGIITVKRDGIVAIHRSITGLNVLGAAGRSTIYQLLSMGFEKYETTSLASNSEIVGDSP